VHPSVDGSDKLFHNSLHGNRYGKRGKEREEIDFAPRSRSLAGRFYKLCDIFVTLRAFKDANVINVLAPVITRIISHIKEREGRNVEQELSGRLNTLKRALDNSISRVNRMNNPPRVNFSTEDIVTRLVRKKFASAI
jgi:hypothetical protein